MGFTNEKKAVIERFRVGTPMNYTVALDRDQTVASGFQMRAIPQEWLLDKDGRGGLVRSSAAAR